MMVIDEFTERSLELKVSQDANNSKFKFELVSCHRSRRLGVSVTDIRNGKRERFFRMAL